eukprot:6197966-Pleurochrysis_carterae.AAC.1
MDIVRDRTTEEERLSEAGAGCGVCALKPTAEDIFGFHYYDFRYLCLPALPWSKGGVAPPVRDCHILGNHPYSPRISLNIQFEFRSLSRAGLHS